MYGDGRLRVAALAPKMNVQDVPPSRLGVRHGCFLQVRAVRLENRWNWHRLAAVEPDGSPVCRFSRLGRENVGTLETVGHHSTFRGIWRSDNLIEALVLFLVGQVQGNRVGFELITGHLPLGAELAVDFQLLPQFLDAGPQAGLFVGIYSYGLVQLSFGVSQVGLAHIAEIGLPF